MNLLSPIERRFIRDHLTDDIRALLLAAKSAELAAHGLDLKKLAAQIAARQKARDKLPTWYANDAVVFPPALSVEQASSEQTARYKALLVSGSLLLDLTGGMGVDTWAFAQRTERVVYVEQRAELAELATHNLPLLGATNVDVQTGDGLAVAERFTPVADWLYLDPHRRNEQGGKVVRLADCEPDVSKPHILTNLLTHANRILLKTSPLIDIDLTIRQISNPSTGSSAGVEAVHVVAVQGEVKEVLFVIGPERPSEESIEADAVNLLSDKAIQFKFTRHDERMAAVLFGAPQTYLYEPNAAVLKAGAFRTVANRFGLTKLAPNSHLYTSADPRPNFPGRTFVIDDVIKPDRKTLQALVPGMKANLTVRNFPQSVADLRKKLALQEGGDLYIFATTLLNGDKRLLITRKADGLPLNKS